ncbi:ABC transporter ATP-binding protein [Companilactobacillus metriopterae]|uniref:ABC transporter ATP-binding protein n=1 Tax=Companilactobacillus metriopterae TaxID=1909267 RepID=UPI00100BC41C|nr:ABC transporter ATP-binding protein [Companilactobacillus metriopterae]
MSGLIEFSNVTKSFGEQSILNNFNFEIKEGEFVAIVGPSGSGKSTILNIIGLLEPFDSGEVLISGQKLSNIRNHQATLLRRNKINYLFQSFALIEDKTVKENLLLSMHFVKSNTKEQKILEVLKMLNLLEKKDALIYELSGGEKQRVALARTLLKPGDIVLADEPTGALDPGLAKVAFQLIREINVKYGKTIIMVTHNMEEAYQTDRIIEIKNNSINKEFR